MPVQARSYRDYATRRTIIEKVVDRRLGHEAVDPPSGWKWDYRYVVEDRICEHLPFPGLKRSHLMGIPRSYWQNGPVSGRNGNSIKVQSIREMFSSGRIRWVPVIHNGDVNIWRDSTYFFSDDSVIEILDASSVDASSRSTHKLERTLRTGSPILVTSYRRDLDGEYLPWRAYSHRNAFTSILDSDGNEQVTRDGDTIYWSVVDTTKKEFITYVRDEEVYLIFNRFVPEAVTVTTAPVVIKDFNDLEYIGTSDGTDDQKFETKKFPVSNDSVLAVYVVDTSAGTWVEYSVVDSFTAANQVQLDEDLGILTFGSSTGSTPAPASGLSLYLKYRVVPRIEYEEEGYSEVSYASSADVSPLSQGLNRGFVTLARADLDIASIELTTTKPPYPGYGDTYGPVYVGADYASLLATVYASSGEVVPNVEVTFYFETSPSFGGIGGSGTSSQRITGLDGIARNFYTPPSGVESLGSYLTSVTVGNKLTLPAGVNLTDEEDIYTYYVLKDDPFVGIPGADTSIGEVEWSSTLLNGRKTIAYKWNAAALNPISGHLGAYAPIRPSLIEGGNVLTYSDTLQPPDTTSYGGAIESGTITTSGIYQITDSSKSWSTNIYDGHIVYSTSLGEYRRIARNTGDTLYLTSGWSSLPSGAFEIYQRSPNLGAYWVVSDRFLTIRASAYSPKLARTIYSNAIDLRVEIPEYMKGSYISSSLQEIPFGFRIIDGSYDIASAIDGATYISINPVAGPYPIVDVIGGETWDPYSGPDLGEEPYPWWPYGAYPGSGAAAPFAHFAISWEIV